MARDDRPAGSTTAGPSVPGPRRQASEQGDAGQRDTQRHDTQRHQGDGGLSPVDASAEHVLERTRLGGVWVAIACFAVVLVFFLFFITQNNSLVSISFLWMHVRMYLGVALVLSAVGGALLVTFAGMARILQLRSRARKHRRMIQEAARR
jgi:lipopolysaccharide assembly protein A